MSISSRTTPYDYLIKAAPLQEAEHLLRAVMPDARTRKLLDDETRRALPARWCAGRGPTAQIASVARLYHPGSRYEMSGRFRP